MLLFMHLAGAEVLDLFLPSQLINFLFLFISAGVAFQTAAILATRVEEESCGGSTLFSRPLVALQ
jgi:hypothetical protein